MYPAHTTVWTHSNQRPMSTAAANVALIYVGHHPTIRMLLLKLKHPPEKIIDMH
jgi:hypothetical protein